MARRKTSKPREYELVIVKQSNQGQGIAYHQDKIIFVDGVMLGETVIAQCRQKHTQYEKAYVVKVLQPSDKRMVPKCQVFGQCGGCSFQYMSVNDQLDFKQNWLKEVLLQHTKTEVKEWLVPLTSQQWGYRRKARLGVRFVAKKNRVLVGFREKSGRFITDMARCEVLHPALGNQLDSLQTCLATLSIKSAIAQIEAVITDEQTLLVLRHLEPLSILDRQQLTNFAQKHQVCWYLQAGGLDTITPLDTAVELYYEHQAHQIKLFFLPIHFTQVNFEINQKMVSLALSLLDITPEDKIIDLFCGLGNFTLPMARYAKAVVGIEGNEDLVAFAKQNAIYNGLDNVSFYQANLSEDIANFSWCRGQTYDKALIDPARNGALEVIEQLPKLGVKTLVYIACNPDTLARDAKRLVELGYTLDKAGIIDMFTHTKHIESIVLFRQSCR